MYKNDLFNGNSVLIEFYIVGGNIQVETGETAKKTRMTLDNFFQVLPAGLFNELYNDFMNYCENHRCNRIGISKKEFIACFIRNRLSLFNRSLSITIMKGRIYFMTEMLCRHEKAF